MTRREVSILKLAILYHLHRYRPVEVKRGEQARAGEAGK